MTQAIFLCHKCLGHVTEEAGPSAYACSCISSYVRDWQSPTPVSEVLMLQANECKARARLYLEQGRKPTDTAVRENNRLMARVIQALRGKGG